MTRSALSRGLEIFIDSNIFTYHLFQDMRFLENHVETFLGKLREKNREDTLTTS